MNESRLSKAIIRIGEYFLYGCLGVSMFCLIIFIIYIIGNSVTLFLLGDRSPLVVIITSILCFISIVGFGYAFKKVWIDGIGV